MATATIATADGSAAPVASAGGPYVGRFAPSPTGPLHLGSLTTALASCLEAQVRGGRWLLRIEDLDTPRIVTGAADRLIHTLAALGFEWDGPIVYQSARQAAYRAALADLQAQGLLYDCGCSRRQRQDQDEHAYAGTCRRGTLAPGPWSIRYRLTDDDIKCVTDGLRGRTCWRLGSLGDPVVRRRDDIVAYQLAVVVDDAAAGVTHIVRGRDLLASTPWQRALQRSLSFAEPAYVHLPLVTGADGSKLAKSANAVSLDPLRASDWLLLALRLLCQRPPTGLTGATLQEMWQWARKHWEISRLRGYEELRQDGSLPTRVVAD